MGNILIIPKAKPLYDIVQVESIQMIGLLTYSDNGLLFLKAAYILIWTSIYEWNFSVLKGMCLFSLSSSMHQRASILKVWDAEHMCHHIFLMKFRMLPGILHFLLHHVMCHHMYVDMSFVICFNIHNFLAPRVFFVGVKNPSAVVIPTINIRKLYI